MDYKTQFIKNEKGEVVAINILREGPVIEAVKIKK